MNLEKMMETYKRENSVTPREEKILETIQKSKNVMMEVQSENTMSYTEFLFSQFRLIRKRWWILQVMFTLVHILFGEVVQELYHIPKLVRMPQLVLVAWY